MSKKVLILSSSPRRGGNSDTLCDGFMRGATEAGNEVKKVFLRDKTIHYCTGCGVCSQYKKPCPQKDDAAEIIEKMLSADVIVLATPVYFYAMSAQLKTLLDRCCGPYTEMINKEFYFLASAAEGKEGLPYLEHVFDNLMGFIDCLENPVVKGKVLATGVWHVGEIKGNPALTEAYEMGKQIS
ncbi:flavodoxin family protein [Bacteroides fragilis]|uniref:flavodoxin family protein n=1 Tax=Bacteroides fragilis TaxID=817 RepID=UPI0028112764|nr:flavodoxin family protein [Bacteroides fragilis]WMI95401.1 flavodoxin family protein [Bacteroides fragilis]